MASDVYHRYLFDLVRLLKEQALDAKHEHELASDIASNSYSTGRLMGYYEVLSLVLSQADAFGIDATEVGLAGFDPERDLL